jgi:hypothetical protein
MYFFFNDKSILPGHRLLELDEWGVRKLRTWLVVYSVLR